jgi:hypothetical protein
MEVLGQESEAVPGRLEGVAEEEQLGLGAEEVGPELRLLLSVKMVTEVPPPGQQNSPSLCDSRPASDYRSNHKSGAEQI